MARHCIHDLRTMPPDSIIGTQPDLFGGPIVSHAAARKPIGTKALQAITKWAVSPCLGDIDRKIDLEPDTGPLPVFLVACVATKLDCAAEARDLHVSHGSARRGPMSSATDRAG
jgi:hypothetical protein